MSAIDIRLGSIVRFNYTLLRRSGSEPDPRRPSRRKYTRTWTPQLRAVREGVVVGVRSLANGEVEYLGEEGTVFSSTERFRAYLIAFDLYRKPVLVLPEHIW